MSDEREVLDWSLFGTASRELATTIAESGYRPDVVLGIARGGLLPAAAIAYALDCKNLFTVNVEFYTGVGETMDAPVMLPPLLDVAELDNLSVLIVDDVADSGKTLELVFDLCQGHVSEAKTAVIYEKPRSVINADFVWRRTDRWINFPWSSEGPVLTL